MKKLSVLALISSLSIVSFASANNSNLKLVNAYEKAPASNLKLINCAEKGACKKHEQCKEQEVCECKFKKHKKMKKKLAKEAKEACKDSADVKACKEEYISTKKAEWKTKKEETKQIINN
jgi:putative hemolysin